MPCLHCVSQLHELFLCTTKAITSQHVCVNITTMNISNASYFYKPWILHFYRTQAMEMRCYRKILRISCKGHVMNEEVRAKIQQAIRPQEDLTIVKRCKLKWYGHVSRSPGLAKTILQGTVKGGSKQGRRWRRMPQNPVPYHTMPNHTIPYHSHIPYWLIPYRTTNCVNILQLISFT